MWLYIAAFAVASFCAASSFAATYSHTYRIDNLQARTLPGGMAVVEFSGATQKSSVVGAPILPMLTSRLYIPSGESVDQVDVTFGSMLTLPGSYVLAHGVSPRPMSDTRAVTPEPANQAIYDSDTPYPPSTWRRVSDQTLHGYRIVLTELYPVRYLPASGQVDYAETVTVTVQTSTARNAVPGLLPARSNARDEEAVLHLIDNGETLTANGLKTSAAPTAADRQYLLITTAALQSAFEPLLAHRASSAGGGFTTFSATVEDIAASQAGRDLAEKIRNYIKASYADNGTQFVLLGGDADGPQAQQAVPTRGCAATIDSYYEGYIPTDYYYACLDGSWDENANDVFGETTDGVGGGDIDWLAEVAVGRIPADTAGEAQNAISKIIAYETAATPLRALLAGEKLDTTPTWGGDRMDHVYLGMGSFPADTLYDRDIAPSSWTASSLQTMLSGNAYSMVFHLGHADVTYSMRMTNGNLDLITNTAYFLVYTQGCYSSSFDGRDSSGSYLATDSMGEDFLVRNSHNAFATLGNSRYGWYYSGSLVDGASNLVHRNFVNAVFQSGMHRLGQANNASKATLGYSDGLYRWISFEMTLMGDPATPLKLTSDSVPSMSGVLQLLLQEE
jgi:hypothetical protein